MPVAIDGGSLPLHSNVSFSTQPGVPRIITGFHQDDEDHWVAELECGHAQHVRHEPPLISRPWAVTAEGRMSMLGTALECVVCVPDPDPAT